MAIAGIILLMARYKAINLKFAENWEEEYQRSSPADQVGEKAEAQAEKPVEQQKAPRARKAPTRRRRGRSRENTDGEIDWTQNDQRRKNLHRLQRNLHKMKIARKPSGDFFI